MATLEELIARARQWRKPYDSGIDPARFNVSAMTEAERIAYALSALVPSPCSCSARAAEAPEQRNAPTPLANGPHEGDEVDVDECLEAAADALEKP